MHNFPEWLKALFVFLLGLEFGSFANVCIHRWPRNSSVIRPRRSHCPWCGASISWLDNIPVLSFFLLRGRCRSCKSPISPRYPAVESCVGLLFAASYLKLGPVTNVAESLFLVAVLSVMFTAVVTTMTDLDWRIIPDDATAALAVVGLATAAFNPMLGDVWHERVASSFLGVTVGGGTVWLVGWLGERAFGKEAMGGGDVKLLASMGAVMGWQGALLVLFGGAVIGGGAVAVGLSTGRLKRHQYIPFGPFLNLAAILVLLAVAHPMKTFDPLGMRSLM
jgi:leader peptidase (prepilin peptidase) / N-methyltransferase